MPRIVNWTEFTQMPVGTIFWEYEPEIYYNPGVVHEWIDRGEGVVDFFYWSLQPWFAYPEEELAFGDSVGRWGTYDYNQLFCVLDDDDRERFSELINGGEDTWH